MLIICLFDFTVENCLPILCAWLTIILVSFIFLLINFNFVVTWCLVVLDESAAALHLWCSCVYFGISNGLSPSMLMSAVEIFYFFACANFPFLTTGLVCCT